MPGNKAFRHHDMSALRSSLAGLRLFIEQRPDQPGHWNLNAGRVQDDIAVSPDIRGQSTFGIPEKRAVVHHMRNAEGALSTYIGRNGDIVLNPPGIKGPVTGLV